MIFPAFAGMTGEQILSFVRRQESISSYLWEFNIVKLLMSKKQQFFSRFFGWDESTTLGYVEGSSSLVINLFLFVLKYWAGIRTGSIAIVADAWHTLSDSLTSLVVLIGFKISAKPPDKKHPFGHSRAEVISSIIIGTLLAIVAFNFLKESIHRFIEQQSASFTMTAGITFIISVLVKEGIARFSFWCGQKIDSRSLMADGWHHRSDAIASALILAGMLLGKYFWWIDSIMGMMVSLLIFYATYVIMSESISSLLGEAPKKQLEFDIHDLVAQNTSQDVQLHHLHFHEYGNHKELTFHIRLPNTMQLQKAHHIADTLERLIRQKMDIEATIHVEPLETKKGG